MSLSTTNSPQALELKLREQMAYLKQEKEELREHNKELTFQLKRRKKLEYLQGGYFISDSNGNKIGALCPECYTSTGFIYLLDHSLYGAYCPVCGTKYVGVPNTQKASPPAANLTI